MRLISFLLLLFGALNASAQIAPQNSPYADFGPYQVLQEIDNSENPDVHTFRPDVSTSETFPVFFFQLGANGLGSDAINANTYDIFLEHLASYGYITILVNSSAAGFPNGNVYQDVYDWYLSKLNDSSHWMSTLADAENVYIGGHSLGGVQATAFLENNQSDIDGIVYFASFPSQGVIGIGAHDIENYAGNLLSIAGTEDEDSTPAECREGYDTYQGTECKYWVLVDGLGHAGFGDYETAGQTVGSIGREDATATIRHYLLSFLEYSTKVVATAEQNLKVPSLRPNTEADFETNCPAILTSVANQPSKDVIAYPNPAINVLRLQGLSTTSVNYCVYSSDGRAVLCDEAFNEEAIDVSNLNSGIYSLRISGPELGDSYIKFIKK